MALASQSTRPQAVGRSSTGNNFGSPRKRRQQRIIAAVAGVLLLGAAVWGITALASGSKKPQEAEKGKLASSDTGATDKPSTPSTGAPKQAQPKPPAPVVVDNSPSKSNPTGSATNPSPQPLGGTSTAPSPNPNPSPANPNPAGLGAGSNPGAGANPATPGPVVPAPIVTPPPAPTYQDDLPPEVSRLLDGAKRSSNQGRLVEARTMLNEALGNTKTKESERDAIRQWLSEINSTLVFSPTVAADDPLSASYKVVAGDNLTKIVRSKGLAIDKDLIARVNRMKNPDALRENQTIKLVRGPFHAVVDKSDFRLDLYAGTPIPPGTAGSPRADGTEEGWTFIRSFRVGLGSESGKEKGTPLGTYIVKKGSKLKNPPWRNPRTGERFGADDPKNPIGERWLGMVGVDDGNKDISGIGIHGTIEPNSIGQEMSMGCVRLLSEDVEIVWEMLAEEISVVRVVP